MIELMLYDLCCPTGKILYTHLKLFILPTHLD